MGALGVACSPGKLVFEMRKWRLEACWFRWEMLGAGWRIGDNVLVHDTGNRGLFIFLHRIAVVCFATFWALCIYHILCYFLFWWIDPISRMRMSDTWRQRMCHVGLCGSHGIWCLAPSSCTDASPWAPGMSQSHFPSGEERWFLSWFSSFFYFIFLSIPTFLFYFSGPFENKCIL